MDGSRQSASVLQFNDVLSNLFDLEPSHRDHEVRPRPDDERERGALLAERALPPRGRRGAQRRCYWRCSTRLCSLTDASPAVPPRARMY